ncbi:putative DNA-directed RNA-polymerase [Pectobacterium phage PP16]|uniref:DNA-directed RNA polymerase n=1 Tax=Pectobacterium phage PP16 TaxID=1873958 RepID=A0A1B1PED0_9CAUD|nr:N4-like RNA polymerase [Pectobacterium phage PP16]ANT45336.1 putative DNA-directed RNA-polymerase [Pectobacterium phage PP16]
MTLEERQIELEKKYTTQGLIDALAHWEKESSEGRTADHYIGRALSIRLYKLVQEALETICTTGNRGLNGKYRRYVREIGYDKAAVVCIRQVLNLCTQKLRTDRTAPLAQDLITQTGTQMQMEYMHHMLSLAAPGYMKAVDHYMQENGTRSVNHRKRTLMASANRIENLNADDLTWSTAEVYGVGSLLLQAAVDAGVITLQHVPKNNGQNWVCIMPVEEVSDKLRQMAYNLHAFARQPPMLVPPRPHTVDTLFGGASYRSEEMARRTRTIHTRSLLKESKDWIRENISDTVLRAANKAASQPYVINTEVVELLRDVYRTGVYNGVAGIPSNTPIKVPPYPLPESWDREDPDSIEIHEAWKATAKEAHHEEVQRKGHVLQFSLMLKYLTEFRGDTLYFPTYFDWRGRLYFHSSINPQGTDFVKASLSFANKKPLGKRGLYWLKVHVATCYGFDKANFDRRATWTDDNMALIREAVENHVDSDFFRDADSHWCFYVAAKDMLGAIDSGTPETWETGVPVAMDATCSGLQHLSAVMRDPVGGMFTNLLPNNGVEKEDIYAGVAAIAVANVQRDRDNIEQSVYWGTHGIPRSMAKRPVMTYVYGGTLNSCTEYVYLDMRERGLEPLEHYSMFKLAAYVSRHLRKGIEAAVPASADCMRFLRDLAGRMPLDKPIRCVSPAGFPMVQHYAQEDSTRIELRSLGIKLVMRTFDDTQMQRSKVISGISPNFTHNLDSAHLTIAINAFGESILPIHDSFATHPCDVDELHTVLRDTFADMHQNHDPLKALVDCVQQYSEEVIELPPRGTLDLNKVKESQFFMC